LKKPALKIFVLLLALSLFTVFSSAQLKTDKPLYSFKQKNEIKITNSFLLQDTTKPKIKTKSFSLSGIFLSVGGGLSVPVAGFNQNSDVGFGFLGRLEYSSTAIFPLIIGGEINYFTYTGADQFKTLNILAGYKTKILSYGLSLEYTLSKLLNSSYTIPFFTIDVKNNTIKREYDETAVLEGLPRDETKISVGAGGGFTLFIFDFVIKYNYMKSLSNVGVYTKIKIPVIRF
jgi:hypothetical protein